jgi:hypothetical protein
MEDRYDFLSTNAPNKIYGQNSSIIILNRKSPFVSVCMPLVRALLVVIEQLIRSQDEYQTRNLPLKRLPTRGHLLALYGQGRVDWVCTELRPQDVQK